MAEWSYTNYWRPNFEAAEIAAWGGSMLAATGIHLTMGMPSTPYAITMGVQSAFALAALPRAIAVYRAKKSLLGVPVSFTSLPQLLKIVEENPEGFYYGEAFEWTQQYGQYAFELLSRDLTKIIGKKGRRNAAIKGTRWIHGLGLRDEEPCIRPVGQRDIHTLVAGTTGAGKTRWFDLAIAQCIARGEAVIVIDPKGDRGLAETCRRTCAALGPDHAHRFKYFHPGHPEKSMSLALTKNYGRATEIASRIAVLMKSDAGDPFQAFAMMALNNVIQSMLICNIQPTLVNLRRTLEDDVPGLVCKVVRAYGTEVVGPLFDQLCEAAVIKQKAQTLEHKAKVFRRLYYDEVVPIKPNSDIEGLLTQLEHDRTHFSKMIAGLLPILVMLTAGSMGPLLSPTEDAESTDMNLVINSDQVLYLGLDSLSDPMVGSTIGSLALADLASTAGEIYNHRLPKPVNIFVDECAEVLNDQLIQILNKGRGAGINLYIATQTIADFKARMGDEAKALQVLANANHIVALRVLDTDTQEFISTKLPKSRFAYVMRTQATGTGDNAIKHNGNIGERLMEEEGERFPTALLGELPDLEFLAVFAGGDIRKGRIPILNLDAA
ncbi:MAG: conjugative transfer system coupling protein TraD [Halopseudomonas aestusnigri]|nr:conjugative transfer system coupling protein TraD [Halopseudomonas aestusnigri]